MPAVRLLIAGVFALAAACGRDPKVPPDATRTVVSLTEIDCDACGDEIISEMRARPGVYEATFERRKAEISVVASPAFDVLTTVKQLAAQKGFNVLLGAGHGQY